MSTDTTSLFLCHGLSSSPSAPRSEGHLWSLVAAASGGEACRLVQERGFWGDELMVQQVDLDKPGILLTRWEVIPEGPEPALSVWKCKGTARTNDDKVVEVETVVIARDPADARESVATYLEADGHELLTLLPEPAHLDSRSVVLLHPKGL